MRLYILSCIYYNITKGKIMPETPESQPDHVENFETLLNEAAQGYPGLNVADLDTMTIVILIRLRSIFSPEQLHQRAHYLIAQTEEWLGEEGALRGDDGEPATPVLVENFEDKEDLINMLAESTKEVSDDEIEEFLTGENTK